MKEFKKNLKPLGNKLLFEKFLHYFLISITVSSVCSLGLFAISKFVFFPHVLNYVFAVFFIGLITSFIIFKLNTLTIEKIAKVADDLGGKEIIITTLELLEKENLNPTEQIVVKKGCDLAKNNDFSKDYKIKYSKNMLKIFCCTFITMMLVGFIPVNREDGFYDDVNLQLKIVEKIVKEINKNEDLTEVEKKEINKILNQLEKDLKKIPNKEDVKKATENASEELKKLEKEQFEKDLKTLADNVDNQNLSQSALSSSPEDIAKALDNFQKEIANLSEEEKQALSENISNMNGSISDEQLKNTLKNASDDISKNGAVSKSNLSDLEKAISDLNSKSQDMRDAIDKANNELGSQGDGDVQGSGEGQGNSEGGNDGDGSGEGQGSGRGDGEGEYTNDGERTAEDKNTYDTQVDGINHETEQKTYVEQKIIGNDGIYVDYGEVIGDYKMEALEVLDKENIPYGMSKLVSDYFMELER